MQFIRRERPEIRRLYIYGIALLYATVVTIQSATTNEEGELVLRTIFIVLFYIKYFVWALIFDWVYGLFLSLQEFKKPYLKGFLFILINYSFLAFANGLISNFIFYIYKILIGSISYNEAIVEFIEFFPKIVSHRLVDLAIILGILKIVDLFKIAQNRKLKVIELENELHLAQLQSLRAQLNPHFLFNSLHALHTLIGHSDEKAKVMVIKMSNLLRRILDQSDKQLVTLEEELDYLRDYLDIEQERFFDRLTLDFNIDPDSKMVKVPSLMLQPLAENAFKHGISLLESKGVIKLTSKIEDNNLYLDMSNSIPLKNIYFNKSTTKVGLKNLKSRLERLYGDQQSINTQTNKTIFTVSIIIKDVIK